jgi:hypothetical protein
MYVEYYVTIIKLHYKSNQLDHIFYLILLSEKFHARAIVCVFSFLRPWKNHFILDRNSASLMDGEAEM